MSFLLRMVFRMVLGRYLMKMGASSFLMLVLQDKIAEVAHSPLENFIMPAVAVVAVFRDVIASWWKEVSALLASGFWLLASAPRSNYHFWGRVFRFSQNSSGMLH